MKILSVEQIREADRLTIEREPIASIDLMERAASKVADRLTELFGVKIPRSIIKGKHPKPNPNSEGIKGTCVCVITLTWLKGILIQVEYNG